MFGKLFHSPMMKKKGSSDQRGLDWETPLRLGSVFAGISDASKQVAQR